MNTEWIYSAGGPLICAEHGTGQLWRGVRASSVGAQKSDYERACDVVDYLSVLRCGSGQVLVLGDEPLQTTIIDLSNETAIVRWVSCATSIAADEALANIPIELPQIEEPQKIQLNSNHLVLFDSASQLEESPTMLEVFLAPGLYKVSTEKYANPGLFEFLIHRMKNASSFES